MNCVTPSGLLRAALAIDAAASGTLALIQILAPHAGARGFGLPIELLVGTGAFLAAYAALLISIAYSSAVSRALVRLVIAGNLGWAFACIALAAVAPTGITAPGVGYLLSQAVAVVAFAFAQALGLRRSEPFAGSGTDLAWKETL
jgi:hypothetical protein